MRNWQNEAIEYMAKGLSVPDFIVKGLIDENSRLKGQIDHLRNKDKVYTCNSSKK